MYQLFYTKNARRDLQHLDRAVAVRVLKKLDYFIKQKDPLSYAKRLKNSDLGEYRFRVGDYRVLFDVNELGEIHVLMVLSIKHRREVYLD